MNATLSAYIARWLLQHHAFSDLFKALPRRFVKGVPLLFRPDLDPVGHAHDDHLLFDLRKILERFRNQQAPQPIDHHFRGTGEEQPVELPAFPFGERDLLEPGFGQAPLPLRKEEETAVQAARQKERLHLVLLERLAEFGRHNEPAFTVNRVLEFSVEHRVVRFIKRRCPPDLPMVGNHFLPLSTTRTLKLYLPPPPLSSAKA